MAKQASLSIDPQSIAPQSIADINACVTSTNGRSSKDTGLRAWMFDNQTGIALTLISILLTIHNLYPMARSHTAPFFLLSYYQPSQGVYVQGWDDIYFVIGSIVCFTAYRAIAIEWIFMPLAERAGLKKKACIRFAEQGWQLVYFGVFWSLGMYLLVTSRYWRSIWELWTQWPARDMSGTFKWYYLMQLSFWIQQIIVINIEKPRKDHYQMLTHHVITSTLLIITYVYRFYPCANVILCIMDIVDFLLPMAKMLKYLNFETACNVAFGVFLATWFAARHVIYMTVVWTTYKIVPAVMPWGCRSGVTGEMLDMPAYPDAWGHLFWPFQDITNPICMNFRIKWIFLGMLLFLQVLSIVWFTMIMRVAINVVRGGSAEDTRSDDEEEADAVDEAPKEALSVQGPSSDLGKRRLSGRVPSARFRGGHGRLHFGESDRKALLGRIGCDKPT